MAREVASNRAEPRATWRAVRQAIRRPQHIMAVTITRIARNGKLASRRVCQISEICLVLSKSEALARLWAGETAAGAVRSSRTVERHPAYKEGQMQ